MNSKSREYNGEALTADSVTITQGSLIEGHYIVTKYLKISGSITSPGEVEAVLKEIAIFDADGNDVTNNYYIYSKSGKLIVWET